MKARNITILVILALALNAEARVVESADSAYDYKSELVTLYKELKREAEDTVNNWVSAFNDKMNEWQGNDKKPQVAPAQMPSRQVASESLAKPAAPAPVAQSPSHQDFGQIIQHAQGQLANDQSLSVAAPGRAGSTDLPKTSAGVPTFALTKTEKDKSGHKKMIDIVVKDIPRLDIGVERSIKASDLLVLDKKVALELPAKPKALASPELFADKEVKKVTSVPAAIVAKAEPPKRGNFQLGQIVTQKKVDDVSLTFAETRPLSELKDVKVVTEEDLQMLAATILFEKKNKCHLVVGLLTDLSTKPAYTEESNFYLGVCAHKMGFHSEAVSRLLKVVRTESKEFTPDAVASLVEDLPHQYDREVVSAIKQIKNRELIPASSNDDLHFVMAREAHSRDAWGEAMSNSLAVSEASSHYANARYFYSVAQFAEGKVKDAEKSLSELRDWMHKKGKADSNLEALIAVDMGRILFMQERFQAANDEYLKVPKDHPLWVQALIEQGWSQLSMDDPAGAIGNMYSLHSPYFKSVFMPESWVVRTIGYLDICQYGDAYRTLTKMEQMHHSFLSKVEAYILNHKDTTTYYNTVKNYIKGKSDTETDGLPAQVIREIARQRGFLNVQSELNGLEDEITQYNFIYGMIRNDQTENAVRLKRTRDRLAKVKFDLANIKKHPDQQRFINEWNAQRRNEEQLTVNYLHYENLIEKSRLGYLKMKIQSMARIDKEKERLKVDAGKQLAVHLKDVKKRLYDIAEGNEFLRYEIFAGSGENIRYQVAGGATADTKRIPSNIKPQKILNWEFDGEYWEDEIGSYRSALKNNCPNANRSRAALEGAAKTTANNDGF